jgi:hypothetical protein
MLCVVYVDDTIFAGPDAAELDKMIKSLTNDHGGTKSSYELEAEGSVQDFLGINITQVSDKSFHLTQTGLIKKILEKTGMTDAASKTTPALRRRWAPTRMEFHLTSHGNMPQWLECVCIWERIATG